MTARNERKRKDYRPIRSRNLPIRRHNIQRKDNHRRKTCKRDQKRQPESFEDPGHLNEKVGSLHLLFGCTPRDVVRKQVRKDGYGQVDAQTPKEEEATSHPLVRMHYEARRERRTRMVSM